MIMGGVSVIEIKFKDICHSCKHRDTYIDENRIYSGNDVVNVFTQIGCNHEQTCIYYYNMNISVEEVDM